MRRVNYKIDDYMEYSCKECKEYLESIPGILTVDVKEEGFYSTYDITYDENKKSYQTIYWEICSFYGIPYEYNVLSFDYHVDNAKSFSIDLSGLCCEICYRDIIEEIYQTKGIVAMNDCLDLINNDDNSIIKLNIKYDDKIITKEEIKELENKIRSTYC